MKKVIKTLIVSLIIPIVSIYQISFVNANSKSYMESVDGIKGRIEFSDQKLFLERAVQKNAAAFYGNTPRTQELYFEYNKDKDAYKIYYADDPALILALDIYSYHEPNNVFFTNNSNKDEHFWKLENVPGSNKYYLKNYKNGAYLTASWRQGGFNAIVSYSNSNYKNNYTELTIHPKTDFGTRNYISVGGTNYNGDKGIEGLRINIDYSKKNLFLSNRTNEKIHVGFGDNKYFELKLLDKNSREKEVIELKGDDIPLSSKYDELSFIRFEIGDIITIYHAEPFRLDIRGSVSGTQYKNNEVQRYRITENGLHSLGANNPLPNSIYKIYIGLDKNYFLATNKYSSQIEKPVMTSSHMNNWDKSNWLFEYNSSKDAYTIKHIGTNEYVTHNDKKIIVKGKSTDNSHYWTVKKHSDGKYSFINLENNLSFDVPGGISYKDIILYKYNATENQKFILEKQ